MLTIVKKMFIFSSVILNLIFLNCCVFARTNSKIERQKTKKTTNKYSSKKNINSNKCGKDGENVKNSNKVSVAQGEKILNVNSKDVDVSARNGAILIDSRTNDVLFAKNANLVVPMASTTKIMTAILAIENTDDLEKYYKVDEKAIQEEGSSMGLLKEDSVNMKGLITGLMLSSGNDAANEIAVRVVKNLIKKGEISPFEEKEVKVEKYIEKFIELMNEKAKKLGLKNTKFSSPSGLGPEDRLYSKKYKIHETTAKDLGIIASYAMKNSLFKKICSYDRKSIEVKKPIEDEENEEKEEKEEKRWFLNHNKLLRKKSGFYYEHACGIKTGFTKEAGRCLVASARQDGVELIAVVLKAKDDWIDCKKLFDYGFSKYKEIELPQDLPEKYNILNKDFKVIGSENNDEFFRVVQKKPIHFKLTNEMLNSKKISCKVIANSVHFNVFKGEVIGEIEYYLDDFLIGKTQLLADRDVN